MNPGANPGKALISTALEPVWKYISFSHKPTQIGIDHNLDRARIKKLLTIGLIASIITGVGDFLLGYAEEMAGEGFAASVIAQGFGHESSSPSNKTTLQSIKNV